ncbi:MAG: hypothetical protein COV67_02490 [Nitrospinae bacterium CG11_big_fil_rev_8_21_14_0_20_56_8]|nr:MAG: hypothetical protein COV67_02490 [Nitrospinae bacterium CG11_big_fil_rev_8_21_14_0_20_56_8]
MKTVVNFSGWLSLLMGFFALFFYIVAPHLYLLTYVLLAGAVANAAFYAFMERDAVRHALKTRAALHGANSFVLIVVVLGILTFINLLTHRHKNRIDLTEGGFYTLAPQTKKIVSSLPREVKMTAFFQTEAPERTRFKDLVNGYLELTDKIELNFVDPDKNPAITKQYGITTYGTVALESGSKETKIKNPTEDNLTNGILKVIKDETKTVYFLEGHGEKDINSMEGLGLKTAREHLEKDDFKVDKLLILKTAEVPQEADLLVIAGPLRPILPEEQKVIEDYLNTGGAVFLMVDPQSEFGMAGMLAGWGVELREDMIVDPLSKLFGGDAAAPVVNEYIFHDITKDFTLPTIFPILRSVRAQKAPGVETVELMQSGANSWAESQLGSSKVRFDPGEDVKGPVPIGVVATRDLGQKDSPPSPATEEAAKPGPKARLVVLGDSDFASNTYFNFSGNGDLFLNTISWLAEEENLISIRPRERKHNPVQLTGAEGSALFLLGTILFPSMVLAVGVTRWWKRRRL